MFEKLEDYLDMVLVVVHMVKWMFLAVITGILCGVCVAFFLGVLDWFYIHAIMTPKILFLAPLGGLIAGTIVYYLAPEAEGHGTEAVIDSIHKHNGKMRLRVVPVKFIATVATLLTGGSAGKEGPAAQMGAGCASFLASSLRLTPSNMRKLVICGVSAGFAAVFGTPIAGAIFGLEVLVLGNILYEALLPAFIAGVVSFQVSTSLGVKHFHQTIKFLPNFNSITLAKIFVSGIVFGVVAMLFIKMMTVIHKLFKQSKYHPAIRPVIGGFLVAAIGFTISYEYLGLGLSQIDKVLEGHHVSALGFFWKILASSLTLGTGGSGGVVTPIFFIGAYSGDILGRVLSMDTVTMSALGIVGVLSACANTPIAASIMAIELFGPKIGVYAVVTCVISYLITGRRTIYSSQKLAFQKADAPSLKKTLQKINDPDKTIAQKLLDIWQSL
jgi:chloride channel protein, CIC family